MSKKKMRKTEMYITKKQHEEVSKDAEKREITFSEMIRKIIDHYLENRK